MQQALGPSLKRRKLRSGYGKPQCFSTNSIHHAHTPHHIKTKNFEGYFFATEETSYRNGRETCCSIK